MSQTLPRLDESALEHPLHEPFPQEDVVLLPVPAVVELVIPVYNEEHVLEASVRRLRAYLDTSFPFETTIRIVDNASTDRTWEVATRLVATLPGVAALHLDRKGRGHALRSAWSTSTAQIVAYMDVDLSTDLGSFLPLVAPLLSGHSDVAIGSRLARGAHVVRGPKRELISRAYNLLVRVSLHGHFSDAQCGFKALRRESAQQLLPVIEDDEWFFDTELLVAAERLGLRVCEVPVDWVDDPDSRVQIWRTAVSDLRGVWRISHGPGRRLTLHSDRRRGALGPVAADQLLRFAGVGTISTLAYLLLFIGLRPASGTFGANTLALGICTLFNLAVHRELGRKMRGPAHKGRFVGVAVGLFASSLVLTTLALLAAHALVGSSLPAALLAVTAANAGAAVLRFAVLRAWVFRPEVSTGVAF
jgi:putative flippase GtrA